MAVFLFVGMAQRRWKVIHFTAFIAHLFHHFLRLKKGKNPDVIGVLFHAEQGDGGIGPRLFYLAPQRERVLTIGTTPAMALLAR